MIRILHFADAHIDMSSQGRHDPETGLPLRVMDFLKALDKIVDTAIAEKVDLVLFAGDAYKDRNPAPTFQREWDLRIMRLSRACIPTLMLVGNHDLSPAIGRAHALQEFETLNVPYVKAIARPTLLTPQDLWGLPMQIMALPWVHRSGMIANLETAVSDGQTVNAAIEERLGELVGNWLEIADPALPVVLAAHASVEGATYGGERSVMLGGDVVLPGRIVRDPRLDYVALGHIHKAQDLNPDQNPPVVYPGSIERVDWGEAGDDKFFVIAGIQKGQRTQLDWRKLEGRRFIDLAVTVTSALDFQKEVMAVLPDLDTMRDAMVRLAISYPRDWEDMFDEPELRRAAECAFEFHLVRRPQFKARLIMGQSVQSLTSKELIAQYFRSLNVEAEESQALQHAAEEIITGSDLETAE